MTAINFGVITCFYFVNEISIISTELT